MLLGLVANPGVYVKRVLVVDDDQSVRRLASYVLATAGFDVAMAGDGREALAQISKERPDIIVLDLNMPVMDGYAFVHEIEQRGRPQIRSCRRIRRSRRAGSWAWTRASRSRSGPMI